MVFFIAKHPDYWVIPAWVPMNIYGFIRSVFGEGEAIDPRGSASSDLACPRCHLQIPDAMVEIPPCSFQ